MITKQPQRIDLNKIHDDKVFFEEPLWIVNGIQKKFLPEQWNNPNDEEESE